MNEVVYKMHKLDGYMSFGKYQGVLIEDIIDDDPQYLDWCLDNVKDFKLCKDSMALLMIALNPSLMEN